ncbi:MAG: CDP-diacylglycerol--glycerol-3-phosphate 3-phosphatidyltransferase [Ruminococcaceae bacterium]|nr:CDP-diacylglycerol--glycerol-3-phosphate 3-phosphatidyltransferase [Oscillospiraceae bacterium]
MNLPNKLTVLRCLMTPLFLLLMLWEFPFHYAAALLVFIAASLTDLIDGKLARKRGQVTNLGKFLDPLADKMLTTAAFIGFVQILPSNSIPWAVMLILAREFAVVSVRLMAAKDGVVVAASFSGKLKTVMQMVAIIYMLVFYQAMRIPFFRDLPGLEKWGGYAGMLFIWISVAATVVSGIQYIWALRGYFKED